MVSYTTRLRLTKQDTGSNSGTWGTVANQQVFDMIDDAAGSLVSVAVSNGAITLTTQNGAADQARAMFLVASGVLTSAAQLVVPSVSKPYFVRNNATGNFALTVRALDAGVTIPADGRMYGVADDGVSVGPIAAVYANYAASAAYAVSAGFAASASFATSATSAQTAVSAQVAVSLSDSTQLFPTGGITMFGGPTAPTGWLLCYGQAVSRTTYATLFAVISAQYGVGDGSSTFNVPDFRGRAPFGLDNMGGSAANRITVSAANIQSTSLGAVGGDEHFQAHTHTFNVPPSGLAVGPGGGSAATAGSNTTGSSGTGNSQNMPPAIIVNFIIKT